MEREYVRRRNSTEDSDSVDRDDGALTSDLNWRLKNDGQEIYQLHLSGWAPRDGQVILLGFNIFKRG